MQFIPLNVVVVEPVDTPVSVVVSIQGEGHPLFPVGATVVDTAPFIGPVSTYNILGVVCNEITEFVRVNGLKDITITMSGNTFVITSKFADLFTRVFKYTTHYLREFVTWNNQELPTPKVISTGSAQLQITTNTPELFRVGDSVEIGEAIPHLYETADAGQTYTLKTGTERTKALAEAIEKNKFAGTWQIRSVIGAIPTTSFNIQVDTTVAAGTYQLAQIPYNAYRVINRARFIKPIDEDTIAEDYTAVYQMTPPVANRQLTYVVSGDIDTQMYMVTPVSQTSPTTVIEEFVDKFVTAFSARVRVIGAYDAILIIESTVDFKAFIKTTHSTLVLDVTAQNKIYPLPAALLGGVNNKLNWCEIELFVNDQYGDKIAHCHTRHFNYTASGMSQSAPFSVDWAMTLESSWEATNHYLQYAINNGGDSKKNTQHNRNIL